MKTFFSFGQFINKHIFSSVNEGPTTCRLAHQPVQTVGSLSRRDEYTGTRMSVLKWPRSIEPMRNLIKEDINAHDSN